MNYLQLANRLRIESGISGSVITTVLNQVGEYQFICDYINIAYADIQNTHVNWNFLRNDFSFNTQANLQTYSPAYVGLTDFGEWADNTYRSYKTASGVGTETYMSQSLYDDFRNAYLFGSNRTKTGAPIIVTQKPDYSLAFYPVPDDVYTIVGEYYKTPQQMVYDTDIPNFASKFHMIIVWRALMFYATQQNAQELYVAGMKEYRNLLIAMEQVLLPEISTGSSLA